jgi:hypothetical protein
VGTCEHAADLNQAAFIVAMIAVTTLCVLSIVPPDLTICWMDEQ